MESAMFNDHHGTPTLFLTNFTKTVKLTKTLITCHSRGWNSFSCDYFKKSRKLLESGFPDRYFWRSMLDCKHTLWTLFIAQVCIVMHVKRYTSMSFAWRATHSYPRIWECHLRCIQFAIVLLPPKKQKQTKTTTTTQYNIPNTKSPYKLGLCCGGEYKTIMPTLYRNGDGFQVLGARVTPPPPHPLVTL